MGGMWGQQWHSLSVLYNADFVSAFCFSVATEQQDSGVPWKRVYWRSQRSLL